MCRHGLANKLEALREEADRRGVSLAETAYVGNDVNDTACLEAVGLPVVPADAWPEVGRPCSVEADAPGWGRLRPRVLRRRLGGKAMTTDPLFDLEGRVAIVTGGLGSSDRSTSRASASGA